MMKPAATLLVALCLAVTTASAAPWTIETVDPSGHAGQYASLAVDGAGDLHVCYYDSLAGDLRYARYGGGAWTLSAIDTAGDVGRFCAIAVGTDNYPRVSYYDSTNRALKYGVFNGTNWSLETADAGPGVGQYTSICLYGAVPIISYHDQARRDLKLASKPAAWALARIDSAGAVGRFTSVANSGNNQTKISYYSDTLRQLRCARQQGSNWVIEAPDPATDVGTYSSLTLTAAGVPVIAYFDSAGGLIKRATKPSAWVVDTADNSGTAGGYCSIALDPAGNPVVSYFDRANGDLRLARRSGTVWALEAVDTAGTTGLYTACKVRSDSTICIAYYDQTHGTLKLAHTPDTIPPAAPQNLAADGASPSPWSNRPRFGLNWTNPADPSGIASSRYKLGSAPLSNGDTTGSLQGVPPDSASVTIGGGQPLYLWLVDGAGNTSHLNSAVIVLRYDTIPPNGSAAASPAYSAATAFTVSWSPGADSGGAGLNGRHCVKVRDGGGPWTTWIGDTAVVAAAYPGVDGHRYFFEAGAKDSAGNVESFSGVPECSTQVNTMTPAVVAVAVTPDTVQLAGYAVLTGRITDNSRVTGAEYFIGSTGIAGTGRPASPVDSFGSASVDVFDTIRTDTLAPGAYRVFLHGIDDAGQWGAFDSVSFVKAGADTVRPAFAIQVTPPAPTVGVTLAIAVTPSEPLHPDSTLACTLRTADGAVRAVALAGAGLSYGGSAGTAGFAAGECLLSVTGYDRWANRGRSSVTFRLETAGEFLPADMVYVWPNPARGDRVNFHYYVNANATVTAEVFTLDGHRIASLAGRGEGGRTPHQAASNAIVWDIAGIASDVYLLRLTATSDAGGSQRTVVKKFAIVR